MTSKLGGAPEGTTLERMQTRAWLAFLVMRTGVEDFSDLDEGLIGAPKDGQSRAVYRELLGWPKIHWDRYQKMQTHARDTIRKLVEQRPLGKGSMAVFDVGPFENGLNVPLWSAFASDELGDFWPNVDSACPNMGELRRRGAPFERRLAEVASLYMPLDDWQELRGAAATDTKSREFGKRLRPTYEPSLRDLLASLSIWRLALISNECMADAEFLLRGLLVHVFQPLLSTHGIYELLCLAFTQLETYDLLKRGEVEQARIIAGRLVKANVRP